MAIRGRDPGPPREASVSRRLRAKHAAARLMHLVQRRRRGVRILTYHSITTANVRDVGQMTTHVDLFEQHLEHLSSTGRKVISARDAVERLRRGDAREAVVLTFDDGFSDLHTHVLPTLERFSMQATAFVVSDRVTEPSAGQYLTRDQLRELAASGRFEIGCHGASHVSLRSAARTRLHDETVNAKATLERVLAMPCDLFAYPYGSFDAVDSAARAAVLEAGFLAAFTGIAGVNGPRTDPFLLRRSRVSWAEELPAFERLLSGAYDWYALMQYAQSTIRPGHAAAVVGDPRPHRGQDRDR